jgi:hypothetical protein
MPVRDGSIRQGMGQLGAPRAAAVMLGLGLLLRAWAVFELAPAPETFVSDARYYYEVGAKINRGEGLTSYEQHYMPLGLAWIHAALLDLGVESRAWMPGLNVLADLLSCLLIAGMAGRLEGRPAAMWALCIGCLYPPFILYTAFSLTETLFMFLALAAYYWYVLELDRYRSALISGVLAGVSFALAVQFKTNVWACAVLIGAAALLVPSLRVRWSFMAAGVTGAALVFGVVEIGKGGVQEISFDQRIANPAVNLYLGRTHARSVIAPYAEGSQWVYNSAPPIYVKGDRPPVVVDHDFLDGTAFIAATVEFLAEHKETLVTYSVDHVMDLFGQAPYWPLAETVFRPLEPALRAVVLVLIVVPAMVTALKLRLSVRSRLLLVLPVVSIVLVAVIFLGSPRYRLPYDGYLIILAAVAYGRLFRFRRGHQVGELIGTGSRRAGGPV